MYPSNSISGTDTPLKLSFILKKQTLAQDLNKISISYLKMQI